MTRFVTTDDLLEAMLARRAARYDSQGLSAQVQAAMATTRQARRRLVLPDWHGLPQISGDTIRVVLVLAVLAALLFALAVAGSRQPERQTERPSEQPMALREYAADLDVLTAGQDWWSSLADVDGNVWAYSPGHVARVDGADGSIRVWSVADDDAFASRAIAPARAGGIWIIGRTGLRWFDGERFETAIDGEALSVPVGEIWGLAETPDGSIWAALGALGPRRWNGKEWARTDPAPPTMFATFLTVDGGGRLWTGGMDGLVAVYDAGAWTTFTPPSGSALAGQTVRFVAVGPDDTTWIATDAGVAKVEDGTWTDITADLVMAAGASPAGSGAVSIAFGQDASVWVAFVSNADRTSDVHVARYDGGRWTADGPGEGLPTGSYSAWLTTTSTDVYLTGSSGLFRRIGEDTWGRIMPTAIEPGLIRQLVAISSTEGWVASDRGIYHFRDGSWTHDDPASALEASGSRIALAPDGRLWAGGFFGVAVHDDSGWEVIPGLEVGGPIAIGPDGDPWVVASRYPADAEQVFRLRFESGAWSAQSMGVSPLGWISSLAVSADGTLWAGSDGFFAPESAGLARYDGQSWQRVDLPGDESLRVSGVSGVTTSPNGDVWVTLGAQTWADRWVARFDGTSWNGYDEADGVPAVSEAGGIRPCVSPDGSIWVPTVDGLARFDGHTWTVSHRGMEFGHLSIAPDGTLWAVGPSGVQRMRTIQGPN
jgi:ligand-binding sensor domain-containing protein